MRDVSMDPSIAVCSETYPDMSKVSAVSIGAVFASRLSDLCGDRNDKRHWYVLEDENPGPPIPHQTASAIFMLQGIEENISTLWDWHDICDKEKEVAR